MDPAVRGLVPILHDARKIPALMARIAKKGINIKGLDARANEPIRFILPSGGIGDGYDAKILPDICAVLIEADRKGALGERNSHQPPTSREARMSKLHDLTEADLLRRAVMNAHARDTGKSPRWVAVMDTFALGSTYAHDLCRLYDLDPDELVHGSRCIACTP